MSCFDCFDMGDAPNGNIIKGFIKWLKSPPKIILSVLRSDNLANASIKKNQGYGMENNKHFREQPNICIHLREF